MNKRRISSKDGDDSSAASGTGSIGRRSAALVNVGFENAVAAPRVVAIVSADPLPIRRLRETALRYRKLIDATNGRRTRTVIVTDSDHVVLSSLQPETVTQRVAEALKADDQRT